MRGKWPRSREKTHLCILRTSRPVRQRRKLRPHTVERRMVLSTRSFDAARERPVVGEGRGGWGVGWVRGGVGTGSWATGGGKGMGVRGTRGGKSTQTVKHVAGRSDPPDRCVAEALTLDAGVGVVEEDARRRLLVRGQPVGLNLLWCACVRMCVSTRRRGPRSFMGVIAETRIVGNVRLP